MWLVAWIGKTDHEAAEDLSGATQGPIAGALLSGSRCRLTFNLSLLSFQLAPK